MSGTWKASELVDIDMLSALYVFMRALESEGEVNDDGR